MLVSFTTPHPLPMMVALLNSHREAEAGSQKGSGKPEITQSGTNRTTMHLAAYVTSILSFRGDPVHPIRIQSPAQ